MIICIHAGVIKRKDDNCTNQLTKPLLYTHFIDLVLGDGM